MNRKVKLITFSNALQGRIFDREYSDFNCHSIHHTFCVKVDAETHRKNRSLLFVCGQDSWCTLKPSFETSLAHFWGRSISCFGDRPSLAHALYYCCDVMLYDHISTLSGMSPSYSR
jgi:hypothetical protein